MQVLWFYTTTFLQIWNFDERGQVLWVCIAKLSPQFNSWWSVDLMFKGIWRTRVHIVIPLKIFMSPLPKSKDVAEILALVCYSCCARSVWVVSIWKVIVQFRCGHWVLLAQLRCAKFPLLEYRHPILRLATQTLIELAMRLVLSDMWMVETLGRTVESSGEMFVNTGSLLPL